MRVVGFASNHHKSLQDLLQKRESVELRNCQIKKSTRDSETLEIHVKGGTKISPSTKQFSIPPTEFQTAEATEIKLDQINDITGPDYHYCDSTGWATVQLWQENIGLLVEGCSYNLKIFALWSMRMSSTLPWK